MLLFELSPHMQGLCRDVCLQLIHLKKKSKMRYQKWRQGLDPSLHFTDILDTHIQTLFSSTHCDLIGSQTDFILVNWKEGATLTLGLEHVGRWVAWWGLTLLWNHQWRQQRRVGEWVGKCKRIEESWGLIVSVCRKCIFFFGRYIGETFFCLCLQWPVNHSKLMLHKQNETKKRIENKNLALN